MSWVKQSLRTPNFPDSMAAQALAASRNLLLSGTWTYTKILPISYPPMIDGSPGI